MMNKVNKIVLKALVYMDAEEVLACSNLDETTSFHFDLVMMKYFEEQKPLGGGKQQT